MDLISWVNAQSREFRLPDDRFPFFKILITYLVLNIIVFLIIGVDEPGSLRRLTSFLNPFPDESSRKTYIMLYASKVAAVSLSLGVFLSLSSYFLYLFGNDKISKRAYVVLKASYIFVFAVGTAILATISFGALI